MRTGVHLYKHTNTYTLAQHKGTKDSTNDYRPTDSWTTACMKMINYAAGQTARHAANKQAYLYAWMYASLDEL